MYAIVLLLKMPDANYDDMDALAKNAPKNYEGRKGFISAAYYSDKEKGEYGMTSVWETLEGLEAARSDRPPENQEMVKQYGVEYTYYVNNYFTSA